MTAKSGGWFPGSIVDLTTLVGTASNNGLPGGWGSHVTKTSTTTLTTTTTLCTSDAVTPTSASRYLKITGFIPGWSATGGTPAASGYYGTLEIFEGGTQLQSMRSICVAAGVSAMGSLIQVVLASPSATAHTYTLKFDPDSSGGTFTIAGGSTSPVYLLVECIGGA